jgi:nucleoid DNA-binding protein/septal ring-binding cell division protein DamX
MKINKAKLIELLVEKTGMEQEDVQDQLDQLIKRIIDAAERGKALEIKEFGLFYFDEKGDLKFDTAKELSTEINFKYAGMEPVELKPPRDSAAEEPDKEIPQDTKEKEDKEEEEDIFGLDPFDTKAEPADPFDIKGEEDDEIEEPKSKNPVISKADKVERENDPFSGLLGDASNKLTDSDLGISEEDLSAEEEKLPIFEPFKEEVIPEKKEPPKPKKVKEEKKSRDPILVVMGVVLVFVLIAAAFFIIPALFQGSDQPEQEIVTEQIPEEALDAPEILTPLEPAQETEVSEEIVEEEPAIEAEPEQPVYGLTGELVEAANDGFSIVLHSLAREENARNQAAALASEGYRVIVNPRIVNDRTVWRVSVGQFPSISEAQARARELPSPYNSNNFIQRIQTN